MKINKSRKILPSNPCAAQIPMIPINKFFKYQQEFQSWADSTETLENIFGLQNLGLGKRTIWAMVATTRLHQWKKCLYKYDRRWSRCHVFLVRFGYFQPLNDLFQFKRFLLGPCIFTIVFLIHFKERWVMLNKLKTVLVRSTKFWCWHDAKTSTGRLHYFLPRLEHWNQLKIIF